MQFLHFLMGERMEDDLPPVSKGQSEPNRQRIEEALRISEKRYRDLVENSPGILCTSDMAGILLSINRTAKEILGYEPDELIGKSLEFILHPNYKSLYAEFLTQIQNEKIVSGIMRVMTKAGEERFLTYRSFLFEEPGQEPYVIGHSQDITEQRLAEHALRRSEDRLRKLVESVPAIFWRANPYASLFTFVNKEAEKLLGFPAEQWLQEREFWENHMHPEDRNRVPTDNQKKIKSEDTWENEYRMIGADGSTVWFRDIVSVIRKDGRPVELIGVMIDMTQTKRAEAERERLIRELQEALSKVKTLSGFIPICAGCKKIRDDGGFWNQIESYISNHSGAEFSHSLCPECIHRLYPELQNRQP